MNNVMEHKGYCGTVEYSDIDKVLFGKVVGVRSLISYEGDSIHTLRKDFEGAVDDYLDMCSENNEKPEKPFKGSFNVRIGSDLHREAALKASSRGLSLNTLVEEAIRQSL